MIVDAHCHAWARWPYQPAVPDPARGDAAALLWEMERNGIDRAVIICASIGGNLENSDYALNAAASSNGRLTAFVDFDCRWHDTHQTPGAAERLNRLVERCNPSGITHYMDEAADAGWLCSAEGAAFLRAAEANRLVLSLACGPTQLRTIRTAAALVPRLPILLHHLARVRAGMRRNSPNWSPPPRCRTCS